MLVAKMHGARNDFVIVDARTERLTDAASFARRVCDRRTGVGADGCIVLEPSDRADVRMRTVNADGSEAEMCGNGIRCAARWLDEAGEGDRIAFETPAGIVRTEVVAREPEYLVSVAMAAPRLAAFEHPDVPDAAFVDTGNPHVVVVADVDTFDLDATARRLQSDPRFPDGVNVHAMTRRSDGALAVRHWERGVGQTMACGTGAIACAAVAIERGIVSSPVELVVPGGRLAVRWAAGNVYLVGPAVHVFDARLV